MVNNGYHLSERDLDLLESALRLRLGNVENFNGAPYIKKVADELDKKGIPYILSRKGEQIRFPWCPDDVICHYGSYGHKLGMFEICGESLMTAEELKKDSVVGYVSLESIVKRIVEAYTKIKEQK